MSIVQVVDVSDEVVFGAIKAGDSVSVIDVDLVPERPEKKVVLDGECEEEQGVGNALQRGFSHIGCDAAETYFTNYVPTSRKISNIAITASGKGCWKIVISVLSALYVPVTFNISINVSWLYPNNRP